MKLIRSLFYPVYAWMQRRKINKRLAELRKRDPFIYR